MASMAQQLALVAICLLGLASAQSYDAVKCSIQEYLARDDYDDGPVMVRLAWHASGTYSKQDRTGGSDGGRLRFSPEADDPANNGLGRAMRDLEQIRRQHPFISYADLYTLAGATAVEAMGGPYIAWRPGRADANSGASSPPHGRFPKASLGADHVKSVFDRLGMSVEDATALIGAHVLGRMHRRNSNFTGVWTRRNRRFSNDFFRVLLRENWRSVNLAGNPQFQASGNRRLHMLPSDLALKNDGQFRRIVQRFADDESAFFASFSSAMSRLVELGVPNMSGAYVNQLNCGLSTNGGGRGGGNGRGQGGRGGRGDGPGRGGRGQGGRGGGRGGRGGRG